MTEEAMYKYALEDRRAIGAAIGDLAKLGYQVTGISCHCGSLKIKCHAPPAAGGAAAANRAACSEAM
jgi:hypothetical protein